MMPLGNAGPYSRSHAAVVSLESYLLDIFNWMANLAQGYSNLDSGYSKSELNDYHPSYLSTAHWCLMHNHIRFTIHLIEGSVFFSENELISQEWDWEQKNVLARWGKK